MNEALPDLVARFRVRQGLFRKELVEAALYELDGYGCVMKTDKVFNPGDTVVLDLVMDMPFDKIRAEGLAGPGEDHRTQRSVPPQRPRRGPRRLPRDVPGAAAVGRKLRDDGGVSWPRPASGGAFHLATRRCAGSEAMPVRRRFWRWPDG